MRLHTLRMVAVGPFAAEQIIDFDRLGTGGLFLFEGPTGVGKSTILDALTFALYGGLASHAGDPARLRSDFAGPDDRPEVALEFSVRGSRHRITRSPEHTRPKRRGTGVTREKAAVHLERLEAGAWASRSHAKDEVGAIVGDLLGLTREQFRQVVLLPQGEFATFLRAGDDERREILGKLFGTQLFRAITCSLQAQAQEATRSLQVADADLQARVSAACEAAGVESDDHARIAALPLARRLESLEQMDVELTTRSGVAAADAASADSAEGLARRALGAAEDVCQRIAQRVALKAALATAEAQRAEHEARRDLLQRARRALHMRPLVELVDAAAEEVSTLQAAVVAAGSGDNPDPQHLLGMGWQELAARAADARTTAGELAHLVVIEDGLAQRQTVVDRHHERVVQLEAEVSTAQARGAAIPHELARARAELESAQQAAMTVAATRAMLDAVAGPARAVRRIPELRSAVELRRADRRAARRAYEEALDHHMLLVDQRLADVRAELAERLVSGDPCLVCGSPEHPAPARGGRGGISEEQVRSAAARRDEHRLVLDEVELALARAEAELDVATRTAGDLSAEQWADRIDQLNVDLASGEMAQAGLTAREAAVQDLAREQDLVGAQLIGMAEALADARAQEEHQRVELNERHSTVVGARGLHGSVRDRASELVDSAGRLEALSAAVLALSRGLEHLLASSQRADREAHGAGFADLAEARAALLAGPDLDSLERAVAEWEASVASALAQLDSAELRAVVGIDQATAAAALESASAELELATQRAHIAREAATVANRQRERFAERLLEVRHCAAARAALAATSDELVTLDLYARGMAGSPRMSLVTFVLRYWFEQVVAAANVRLASMSSGKYELIRIDEAARKDARVGLGLSVLDRHTGRERSPGTLSGGETFYTSLALALGLADVVVAQAGGAQLDTLFIDEGFGSLDPDTLDDVMGVIDELRGNGRVIGIVSHVPELKERIPERLTVRRTRPDGPSAVAVHA
ncbi:MAG: AAA family ATPase [Candidatus Nanopelagicales bacterium]|jgi:exonuclease SbcC|nr:AAA family ATPase [Candidatus Nanopelagicales bacterium]